MHGKDKAKMKQRQGKDEIQTRQLKNKTVHNKQVQNDGIFWMFFLNCPALLDVELFFYIFSTAVATTTQIDP